MRNKIDNILLGTLWLIAATLITCFWFNTMYGFNIFSGAHWDYLAQMQAIQTSVKPSFYISMIVCTIITIAGLYVLIRPKFKRIKIQKATKQNEHNPVPKQVHTEQLIEEKQQNSQPQQTPSVDFGLMRPARLNAKNNLQTNDSFSAPVAPIATVTPNAQQMISAPKKEYPEIQQIFEHANYEIKPAPKISGIQTSLLAVGANETLWLGGVDISTDELETAINTMKQVFTDTLDDIEITIVGFVLNPTKITPTTHIPEILTFDTIEELQEYVSEHPNEELDEDMRENFEAFSTYISTVIDYIGKI